MYFPLIHTCCNTIADCKIHPYRCCIANLPPCRPSPRKVCDIQVDPVCMLCKTSDETTMHFILECCVLDFLRKPILEIISSILRDAFNIHFEALDSEQRLQTILDFYVSLKPRKDNVEHVLELEHHCRRLCYSLHSHIYKLMCTLPTRKRYGL